MEELELEQLTEEIHLLIEEKNVSKLKQMLAPLNPADIALIFQDVEKNRLSFVFRILPKEIAAEVFVEMEVDQQELLISAFSDKELHEVIAELYMDDTVDLIEEMPANVVTRILRTCDAETRRTINELLKYPENSAGSIMTTEFVSLIKGTTVAEAFARIRKTGVDKETIYTCYVTDRARKIKGVVTAKDLILSESDTLIDDIMETNVIFVDTHEDRELVATQFQKYDLLALPVVDGEERLVGIVTVDDAMDVLEEEVSEDIAKMAAVNPLEDTYFKTSVFNHTKNRLLWLIILMLSATFTGIIIQKYELAISAIPTLVAFIPMLMGTGGNSGAQASAIIIRGLAIGEVKSKDYFRAVWKELRIALLVGLSLSLINTARLFIMYGSTIGDPPATASTAVFSLVTAIALVGTVVIAKFLGCSLPILASKLKIDPAIMASPMITTIVDAASVLIYFAVATAFLNII